MTFMPKPEWLRKKIRPSLQKDMAVLLGELNLNTVCQEAMCPNISECFGHGVATFMILGTECTRQCTFCAVSKDAPMPPDPFESKRIAEAVMRLGLRHVVITSPTRDDLKDGGAEQFCEVVHSIKAADGSVSVELLIPDMKGDMSSINMVSQCGAEIIGHNIETVPRLYGVRKGSSYKRSLNVLKAISESNPACKTKSAIMLGLGEREEEVLSTMCDIFDSGVRLLSIGQYLSPSHHHAKVIEYVEPQKFDYFYRKGMEMGFEHVKSSPYTRSSYMAHQYLEKI